MGRPFFFAQRPNPPPRDTEFPPCGLRGPPVYAKDALAIRLLARCVAHLSHATIECGASRLACRVCAVARINAGAVTPTRAHAIAHFHSAIGFSAFRFRLCAAPSRFGIVRLAIAQRKLRKRGAVEALGCRCIRPTVANGARRFHVVDTVAIGVRHLVVCGGARADEKNSQDTRVFHKTVLANSRIDGQP